MSQKFDGFQLGSATFQFDDTLLLIEPEAANQYDAAQVKAPQPPIGGTQKPQERGDASRPTDGGKVPPADKKPDTKAAGPVFRSFHGAADVSAAIAKLRLVEIADEIVSVLISDPNASVRVVVEISAEFPQGAKDGVKRAVSENAKSLGLKSADWE
jgi:hypothetical protein